METDKDKLKDKASNQAENKGLDSDGDLGDNQEKAKETVKEPPKESKASKKPKGRPPKEPKRKVWQLQMKMKDGKKKTEDFLFSGYGKQGAQQYVRLNQAKIVDYRIVEAEIT